jgi:predicted phosphoribosyltransferase
MRYFKNRTEAGQQLADKLLACKGQQCAVVSLSEGGVLVGAEIAKKIHSSLYLLMIENIKLPGENDPVAVMSSAGTFTYNDMLSPGELEEIKSDYHQVIDQERLQTFQKLNRIIGKDGEINKNLLKRHIVILVSDGLGTGLSLAVAADFMKSIAVKKIIITTPIASVKAVDKMHTLTDEIFCLGVTDNYMGTEHYYENNDLPPHQTVVKLMKNIVLNW